MPTITSIQQQKNKNRVSVYLDNKYGFGIDLDNFVILKLKVGQELTDKEVEKAVKTAEYQKTLDKLLRFAMVRPRSEKEVTDYFRRKKVHESITDKLTEKLRHLELIDDLKFAKWWVDQRQNFKPKTKRILKIELTKKGIVREIINTILDETPIDEAKMAQDLLTRKAYKWKGFPVREAKQKKSIYLAGKGFSWETINRVIGENAD
jgi:regulatory protein